MDIWSKKKRSAVMAKIKGKDTKPEWIVRRYLFSRGYRCLLYTSGYVNLIDVDKVIPDRNLSIYEGAIVPLGKYTNAMIFWQIEALLEKYDFTIKTPVKDMPDDAIDEILLSLIHIWMNC